jgi:hypothetical protein
VKDVDPTSSNVERIAGATETNRVFGNVYDHVECIGRETKDKSCALPQNPPCTFGNSLVITLAEYKTIAAIYLLF